MFGNIECEIDELQIWVIEHFPAKLSKPEAFDGFLLFKIFDTVLCNITEREVFTFQIVKNESTFICIQCYVTY